MSSKTFDKFLDQQIKILKSKASETEDVMGLLVGEPQTSQGGKKIKGTLAYAGVSLNNRLYLPEELKKGDGMTVPLILNHASTAGAEEELDRLPQEFRSGLEQGKEMRVGEVSLQWDPDNLTLYYTGEVTDQFFQSEVDDANMAVSLGMYYDSDSPQVCDESCYTVIKGAEFHEVSLVYHPGFPIATIEAYEALQRKQRLGESLVKLKFNEGIVESLFAKEINVMANYEEDADRKGVFHCKRCGGTINDIPKEETGQDKGMLELHLLGHDRDDKNKNARGDHKERYGNMKKWWEKPIAESKASESQHCEKCGSMTFDNERLKCRKCGNKLTSNVREASEYVDGDRVWCDVCGGSKSDHMEGHDFISSQDVHDPRVKESKTKAVEMPELVISRRQGENILLILEEELEELRAEEPKDYKAIGRVRLLIVKTRKEIFPDQDPYLTIDLDSKKLEDQESLVASEWFEDENKWSNKEDSDNEKRYNQWGSSGDPHDHTTRSPDGSYNYKNPVYNRTGAMRTSNYKHKHIEDSQSDNWSRGGYGDRREGQITHTWQMFRNQLKPFNPDDMERTFSLWINFAQNQGISYEKANQYWKNQDIASAKGRKLQDHEASWKHCKKCDQMKKFSQSYDHSTGTKIFDHNPDGKYDSGSDDTVEQGIQKILQRSHRIEDGDPDPRYMQYCQTCDTPSEDNVSTNYPIANEVIFCDFCNKTFPENNWQKKAQHELDDHGGKQSKLFDSQSLIRKDLLR